MRYTFNTLNDRDLEELSRDLLTRELGMPFQSFKPGKDQGIDLRYSTPTDDNSIIAQVKHYEKSGIKALLRDLKKTEYPKIVFLAPTRYILVTSLPLGPNDKKQIKETLAPFIESFQDIVGQEDLNRMILSQPDVETSHFKLWISSTPVITRILQNAIKGRSAFAREKIEQKIHLFVANKTHEKSVLILNKKNFLLITGDPGIGKSTLSDMLCYQLMAKDYELIYTAKVEEAEQAFLPEKKQVFYLDDFLGTITLALHKYPNFDSQIIDFIRRVQSDKSKRLILNCRTIVLNQAKELSERIELAKLELAQYEVVLGDYSEYHKARILYNHIYSSELRPRYKAEFTREQFYWKIIQHRNYNPRIIEFLTDPDMIEQKKGFQKAVLSFLDFPEKIWSKTYNKQVTWYARLMLRTLFSFGRRDVKPEHLQKAFASCIAYEVSNHGRIKEPNLFNRAVKELEGAYIATSHTATDYGTRTELRILNPSLEDYLVYYYSAEGIDEYFDVLKSAVYSNQVGGRITTRNELKKISLDGNNRQFLWEAVAAKIGNYESVSGNPRWQELVLLTELFNWNEIVAFLMPYVLNFNRETVSWPDYDAILNIFKYIHKNGKSAEITSVIDRYLLLMAKSIVSHYQITSFQKMIDDNPFFRDRLADIQNSSSIFFGILQNAIDDAWKKGFDTFLLHSGNIETVFDEKELKSTVERLIGDAKSVNEKIGFNPSPIFGDYKMNYKAQVETNLQKTNKTKDKLKIIPDNMANEPGDINELFNSNGPDWSLAEPPF
jgi:energy-coupling factor transporter ATP-binding protein EcfA2